MPGNITNKTLAAMEDEDYPHHQRQPSLPSQESRQCVHDDVQVTESLPPARVAARDPIKIYLDNGPGRARASDIDFMSSMTTNLLIAGTYREIGSHTGHSSVQSKGRTTNNKNK